MRITEAEIHSITRRFFVKNGFTVVSRTPTGQEIHYRLSIDESKYKIPDLVCFKNSKIIVLEQKIEYNKLFSGLDCDVNKINSFLNNDAAVSEFLLLMKEFEINFDKDSIVGGFSSLFPKNSKHVLDSNRIQTAVEIDGTHCTINLLQDSGLSQYFPFKSLDLVI